MGVVRIIRLMCASSPKSKAEPMIETHLGTPGAEKI